LVVGARRLAGIGCIAAVGLVVEAGDEAY